MFVTVANKICEYCGKEFKTDAGFEKHLCEKKKRALVRNEKPVRLALHLFNEFYRTQMGGTKQQTFETFEKSSYYKAFVKFAKYCHDSKVIAADHFLRWLIEHKIRVDRWASDVNYDQFLIEYLKIEPAVDALERAMRFSIDWAEKKNMPAHTMLQYMSDMSLVQSVQSGKLSPWVLYLSRNGQDRLEKLHPTYIDGIWAYISPAQWHDIIANRKEEAEYLKNLLKIGDW